MVLSSNLSSLLSTVRHLQKFSDDSVSVIGGKETDYRELVVRFVAWCGNNHLLLNVTKTMKMVVDLKRTRGNFNTFSILGEEVEVVDSGELPLTTDWARRVTLRLST